MRIRVGVNPGGRQNWIAPACHIVESLREDATMRGNSAAVKAIQVACRAWTYQSKVRKPSGCCWYLRPMWLTAIPFLPGL